MRTLKVVLICIFTLMVLTLLVLWIERNFNPYFENISKCVKTEEKVLHESCLGGALIGYMITGGLGGALIGAMLQDCGDKIESVCLEYAIKVNPDYIKWENEHKGTREN